VSQHSQRIEFTMAEQVLSNQALGGTTACVSGGIANSTAPMVKLSVDMIRPPVNLDFSLYIYAKGDKTPRLYRDSKYPLKVEDIDRLKQSGTKHVYVVSNEIEAYCDYLKETVVEDTAIAPTVRYEALRQATRSVFNNAAANQLIDEVVDVSEYLDQKTVDLICGDETLLADLFQVMTHDYDTFNHAVNVSTYCVMIAREMRCFSQESLVEIAQGALLHDYGKQYLPSWLLNQADPLSQAQKETVMEHPKRGFEELCSREDLS